MKEYLELKDDKSSKFWSVEVDNEKVITIYGKIGSTGKADTKSFSSEAEAQKEASKLLNSKLKKGYIQATPPASHGEEAKIKTVAKPVKKKAPVITEIVAPDDVVDDGIKHPWQSEDDSFWNDGFDEETFAKLRDPEDIKPAAKGPEKDVVKDFDEKEYSRHLHKMEDSGRFAKLDKFLKELDIVKQYAVMAETVESDKPSYYMQTKDYYKHTLTATLKWIFKTISFKKNHIKIIETLLKEGANFESVAKDIIGDPRKSDRVRPLWKNFIDKYRDNPDYTQTTVYFEDFLTGLFKQSTDIAINLVNTIIEEVKNGKHPKFKGEQKFPNDIRGLELYIHDYDKVVIYGITTKNKPNLAEENLKGLNDLDESLVSIYALDYLKSKIKDINIEGLNSISSGIMQIKVEGINELLYESKSKTFDEKLRNKADLLERSEDWNKDSELIDEVVNYLVYQEDDSDRALRIIKRFLYSGYDDAEENARKALERYDDGDRRTPWWFERAVYWWDNFDYDWAFRTIKSFALEKKYPPAVAFYENLLAEGVISASKKKSDDDDDEEDEDYYTDEFGYGNEAQVQEFLDKFTEDDRLRETDNAIMRAYSNGRVYIYFKRENEQAYKEALDFLLLLIDKEYVRIFDGYELCVRFVAEPEFIPKIDLPATQCNAFFARAVRYQSLHERIRQYVLKGMNMFDRYHDLNGDERCTVVGAYAASALSLLDKKHLDLAIRYGKHADGEHEETQLELAYALDSVYGVDKDTAPAIYELTISYDQEHKVDASFYKDPEVLAAFTQYLYADDSHFKEGKIVRFMGCMFPRGGLKAKMTALKAFYDNAPDVKTKNIYADFYNLVIDSDASLSYSELNLEPLEYQGLEGSKTEKSTRLTLNEEQPVVITIKEAADRGLNERIIEKVTGRYSNNFSPPVLTDPRFVEITISEFRKRCERKIYDKVGSSGSAWNEIYQLDDKWMIDLTVAPYQYGIFIYNGKDRPVVLYGALRYTDLLLKTGKRKINNGDIEALMEEYAIDGIVVPPGSPIMLSDSPVQLIMDQIRIALLFERYNAALIGIEKIKPTDGEFYKSALVFKAFVLEQKLKISKKENFMFSKDREALKQLYDELIKLLPEHMEYWQEKLLKL